MAVIDLGEAPREPSLDDASPPRRTAVRRLALVAVLALLVGTVAAAAPAPRPLPSAVVPAPLGAVVVLADDRLFVLDPLTADPAAQLPPQVAVYRLPGAVPLARVPLMVQVSVPTQLAGRVGDTLLLITAGEPLPQRIVAVNGLTGAAVWSRDASFEGLTTGGYALLRTGEENPTGSREPAGELSAIDVTTGTTRWSFRFPAGTVRSAGYDLVHGRTTLLVLRLPSGRLELRDVRTGQVAGGLDLPAPEARTDPALWYPQVVGDLVLIRDTAATMTAYGVTALDRRWTATVPAEAEQVPLPWDCAPVISLTGPQGGIQAVDPATGRTLWTTSRLSDAAPFAGLLVGTGIPDSGNGPGPAPVTVLDPRTGQVLADLGTWQVVGPSADGRHAYGVRFGSLGRAWVAELDPVSGSTEILSRLDRVSADCQAQSDVLVCRRLDGSIGLWDLAG